MILPLDQLCVSRELAVKMRDLGFPQDTYFWWIKDFDHNWRLVTHQEGFVSDMQNNVREAIAAPTSGEIGVEILKFGRPSYWDFVRDSWVFKTPKNIEDEGKVVGVDAIHRIEGVGKNQEAEAKGRHWCYLKERRLI